MSSSANPANSFLEMHDQGGTLRLKLRGEWVIAHGKALEQTLQPTSLNAERIIIDGSGISKLDTAGAVILQRFIEQQGKERMTLEGFSNLHQQFCETIFTLPATNVAEKRISPLRSAMEHIGRLTLNTKDQLIEFMTFFGKVCVILLQTLLHPRRLRPNSIVKHMQDAGINAMPIVSLLAFLISIVLAYQAANQLQNYGAQIFTIDLTVISILREMGVVLTAIMVAGRSGSAFAAEIGVMKLREEISALQTIGIEPFEVLVLPRIIALVLILPVLTFVADLVGLAGGSVLAFTLLDIPLNQYIDRVDKVITLNMFMVGIIKAPVFAFIIALVGTFQGMRVSGSAESVGKLTTVAVVQAIFLIIMADALFSVIFSKLGI